MDFFVSFVSTGDFVSFWSFQPFLVILAVIFITVILVIRALQWSYKKKLKLKKNWPSANAMQYYLPDINLTETSAAWFEEVNFMGHMRGGKRGGEGS